MNSPRKKKRKKSFETIAIALACGASVEAAAQKAGVSARTVHRRLADPEFQARVKEIQQENVQRVSAALNASGMEATRMLLKLMTSAQSPMAQLHASKAVLELGSKFRERADLEERLVRLEQTADRVTANTAKKITHKGR